MFYENLQDLHTSKHVHSTRLAQKLQQQIPNLEIHSIKSDTVLSSKKYIGYVSLNARKDYLGLDDGNVLLMRAAKLTRKVIFEKKY